MKKVLIVACIILSAVVSNAESCNWKFTWATDAKGVDLPDGSPAFLVAVSEYARESAISDLATGKFNTKSVVGSGTTTITGNGASLSKSVATELVGKQSFYTVLVKGSLGGAYQYMVTDLVAASMKSLGDTNVNFGELSNESGVSIYAWNSYTPGPGPEPVPEPTSAMLLMLGAAGLALKRKRA